MPHINIKLIGEPSNEKKAIVADKIAKIIETEFGKARKYISIAIESKDFDEWSDVYETEIKNNKNIVMKPQYTNPKTFQ